MQKHFILLISILLLGISSASHVYATHIRAGDLTIKRLSPNSLLYEVTVVLYRDVSGVPAGEGTVDFGAGENPISVSPIPIGLTPDGQTQIINYKVTYTFPSAGTYKISYLEKNRNENVRNMDGSIDTPFYIESEFLINPLLGLNSSPQLKIPPVLQARIGQKYVINAGAVDAEGDSLSYRLTICKQGRNTPVQNYRFPDDTNESWTFEREDCTRPGEFYIDEITGDLVWDTPNEAGEYNVAFFVDEWRNGVRIGSVNRDMQIIVNEIANLGPVLTLPKDTCIVAGSFLQATIAAEDKIQTCATGDLKPQKHKVEIELMTPYAPPETSNPTLFTLKNLQDTGEDGYEEGVLDWQTTCNDVRKEPYNLRFQAVDKPNNPALQLGDTQTWRVSVIGPAPTNLVTTVNEKDASITLNWDKYECGRADKIMIYRRVGSLDFTPSACETGLPEYTGYRKIAEIDISDDNADEDSKVTYIDSNIPRGSNYCYRIYATFASPQGGESLASNEACGFIPNFFYLTNVSVDKTDTEEGEITVKWTPPTPPLDETLSGAITYKLFRSRSAKLSGKANPEQLGVFNENQTEYKDTGLNTASKNEFYHYWVELSDATGPLPDDPRTASMVVLKTTSELNSIILDWEADVPWNNTTPNYEHTIYKKKPSDSDFIEIGSINTHNSGLTFTDFGNNFDGDELIEGEIYCYKIETIGEYTSDDPESLPDVIKNVPLINVSQEICATLLDTIPPCPPVLTLKRFDCNSIPEPDSSIPCEISTYTNELSWTNTTGEACEDDIVGYNLYYTPQSGGQFVKLNRELILDLIYLHTDLPSVAGRYYVTAVDESDNESAPSNIEEQDNECAYYALPNAFSPNGDNVNDYFTPLPCPLFVKEVKFEVVNRWGELIFESNDNILLEWDGRNKNGDIVPSGTYYYQAEVTFYRLNESDSQTTLKGWIQLLRTKDDKEPERRSK